LSKSALPYFVILLLAGLLNGAPIVPGRYIVELSAEPAAIPERGSAGKSATRSAMASRRAAVLNQQSRVRAALSERSVQVVDSVDTVANALVVQAQPDRIAELFALSGVIRIVPVRLYKKLLDRAVLLQGVTDAWAHAGGIENAGAGTKIAIIDTGIDVSHPAFQDAGLPALEGFPKVNHDTDLEHTNGKVIVARNYDPEPSSSARDSDGHGTSVAMIAAGVGNTGPHGTITGIAPKAYVGSYKVFADGRDSAPTSAVLKALDDAVADGMDVINLSLGGFPAERPASDIIALAVERAVSSGVIVVAASGNEGPGLNTIGSPGTAASAITVGNAYTDRLFAGEVQLEGAGSYLAVPAERTDGGDAVEAEAVSVSAVDSSTLACQPLPANSLEGKIALIQRGDCFFEDKLNHAQSAGAIAAVIYTRPEAPAPFTMAVGAASLPAAMISYADAIDIGLRLESDPALKLRVDFSVQPRPVDPNHISDSSSRGPNADFAIKPDLIAVGTSVYTAGRGGQYIVGSGTSFSAPMVAGAAAVLKAGRRGLTAAQYRSLLINASSTFLVNGVLPASVQESGTGRLNLIQALRSSIAVSPASVSFGSSIETADEIRRLTVTNIGSSADTYSIDVQQLGDGPPPSVSGGTLQLAPGSSADITVRFSSSGLAAGAYDGFVVIRSSSSDSAARIPYWHAVRSDSASEIAVYDAPSSGRTMSRHELLVRAMDASGIPLTIEPKVTSVEGGGTVTGIRSRDEEYPGVYEVDVLLGSTPGDNIFVIEAGGITRRVTVTASE
jgi:subtilisin family serine protease